MPAIYAHYRFGCDVLNNAPVHISTLLLENKAYFDIGLHGPDLLFYYKPLFSNPVNRIGFSTHDQKGRIFFEQAAKIVKDAANKDASLAYLYGSLCHYALDSMCHPYIEEVAATGTISHTEIESSFDLALMQQDNYLPLKYRICSYISPNLTSATILAPFYKPCSPKQILKAQHSFKSYNRLLYSNVTFNRLLINTAFKISGNYHSMKGLLLPKEIPSSCLKSNQKLKHLYEFALIHAATLFAEMEEHLKHGTKLSALFDHTYGAY